MSRAEFGCFSSPSAPQNTQIRSNHILHHIFLRKVSPIIDDCTINNSEIYGKPIDKTGKCVKIMSVPCRTLRNCVRVARQSLNLFVAVRIRVPQPTKNALLSTKTKVRFLNDVCLRQMMLASPMMTATPNDVWLCHILWQTSHHCETKWSNIIFA